MSIIKQPIVSSISAIKPVSFHSLNASKLPGMVEDKSYEWILEMDGNTHQVTLKHDMRTGELEGCLDGKPFVKKRVPPNDIFYSYFYDFRLGKNFLDIMHTPDACQLNINDVPFTELYNKEHSDERLPTFFSKIRNKIANSGEGSEFTNVMKVQQKKQPDFGLGQYGLLMTNGSSMLYKTVGTMKQEIPNQVEPVVTARAPYINPYGIGPQTPSNIPQQANMPTMPQQTNLPNGPQQTNISNVTQQQQTNNMTPPPLSNQPPQKPFTALNIPPYEPYGSLVGQPNPPQQPQDQQVWQVQPPPNPNISLFGNKQLNSMALRFAVVFMGIELPMPPASLPPQDASSIQYNPGVRPAAGSQKDLRSQSMPRQQGTSMNMPQPPNKAPPSNMNMPPPPLSVPPPQSIIMPPLQNRQGNQPPLPSNPKQSKLRNAARQNPLPVMQASQLQSEKMIRQIESHMINLPNTSSLQTIS